MLFSTICRRPVFNSSEGVPKQLLRAMKLMIFFLIVVCLHVSAAGYGQKGTVTISGKDLPLEKVFNVIKKQTDYMCFYDYNILKETRPVSLNFKDADVQEVLKAALWGQGLDFSITGKTITIMKKVVVASSGPVRTIKAAGVVYNEAGQPLSGANVTIKATGKGTITNAEGEFMLPAVPEESPLVISFIGYAPQVVKVSEGKQMQIYLRVTKNELDKVVVQAYGTTTQRLSTGNIAMVTSDQIERQPVMNPLTALQGQVPGLVVSQVNGYASAPFKVEIRGRSVINPNLPSEPLYIIDGVPLTVLESGNAGNYASGSVGFTQNGFTGPAGGQSPFFSINPNDIESITILKDADATAIYGTKGANGVVLITTKRGKAGKTTFDLNINTQFNEVARPIQLLNTQQYLQLRKEAFAADGITPNNNPNDYSGAYAPDLTIYDQNKYTNWQKVIQGNNTNNTDIHASVSGGNNGSTFIVSGGYTRSDYNYPGNFADQRFTLHSGVRTTSADKKFTLDLVTDYTYDQNNSAGFGGSQDVILPPNAPDEIDANGNLIWSYKGVPVYSNFYATLKQPSNLQTFNFNSSLNLNYEIIKGLKIGASIGYSRNTGTEHSIDPLSSQDPSPYGNTISAAFGNTSAQDINIEPQINYSKSIGKGELTALIGGTYEKNTTDFYQNEAYGYSNDAFLNSINGASTQEPYDQQSLTKYVAFFGRLKYIYDQKYILEFSGRRDGSSNFGPGRQFGTFGSVGAGWIFSEEKAFKDALPFFSYGKLSGSYGTTGSDASQAYQFQALYGPYPYGNTTPFQGIRQNIPKNLYNPNFQWATKKSLNAAIDLGFFNNRLLLDAAYYRDRQGDELVAYPLAAQAGFPTVFENQNALVQNKGWEFTLTSTNVKTEHFTWTTSFNLTFNRNKLLAFPNLDASPYYEQYVIGQPTSVILGYRYKDVNPTTGQFEYYKADGSVTTTPDYHTVAHGGDEVVIGNREINYMGGFGNTFTYKRISLYVFCQFQSGMEPNALSSLYNNPPGFANNLPAYVLGKYWTGPGDTHATLQRLASSYNSSYVGTAYTFGESTGAYTNDTYLRVKTAALSYTLPDAWMQKISMKSAAVFCNIQNLFTITNYKFGDPEQPGSFTSFPLQRIIAFGVNFKF